MGARRMHCLQQSPHPSQRPILLPTGKAVQSRGYGSPGPITIQRSPKEFDHLGRASGGSVPSCEEGLKLEIEWGTVREE